MSAIRVPEAGVFQIEGAVTGARVDDWLYVPHQRFKCPIGSFLTFNVSDRLCLLHVGSGTEAMAGSWTQLRTRIGKPE